MLGASQTRPASSGLSHLLPLTYIPPKKRIGIRIHDVVCEGGTDVPGREDLLSVKGDDKNLSAERQPSRVLLEPTAVGKALMVKNLHDGGTVEADVCNDNNDLVDNGASCTQDDEPSRNLLS